MTSVIRKIISCHEAPGLTLPLRFSQGVLVDNTMYISGNLGMNTNLVLVEGMETQTRLALDNIGRILQAAGGTFKNVVKVTILLSDISNSTTMNKVYGEYFTENFPARAAYQVAKLPRGGLIEIEAVAVIGNIVDEK